MANFMTSVNFAFIAPATSYGSTCMASVISFNLVSMYHKHREVEWKYLVVLFESTHANRSREQARVEELGANGADER